MALCSNDAVVVLVLHTNTFERTTNVNAELLEKWRDDLRTTTEKQKKWTLGNSEVGFCCLGRLCVVTGEVFPSRASTPDVMQPKAYELLYTQHLLDLMPFTRMNDGWHMTFQEIADIIDIILIDPDILLR